jgi:hypothetical protein
MSFIEGEDGSDDNVASLIGGAGEAEVAMVA